MQLADHSLFSFHAGNNLQAAAPYNVVGSPSVGGTGAVIMIYGLTPGKHNCDSVFNLLCSYGNVLKVTNYFTAKICVVFHPTTMYMYSWGGGGKGTPLTSTNRDGRFKKKKLTAKEPTREEKKTKVPTKRGKKEPPSLL